MAAPRPGPRLPGPCSPVRPPAGPSSPSPWPSPWPWARRRVPWPGFARCEGTRQSRSVEKNQTRRSAVSSWTPRRVLDAVMTMEWSPDGAHVVLTDDYRLIRYPDRALDPAFPAAQVTRSRTRRAVAEVIDEVVAQVRRWRLPGVAWWVSSGTSPPDTEAVLRARGGKRIDAVRILARELNGGPADLAVPANVS